MTVTNILLVCANPRGTDSLRTAEEDRTLRESIQLSRHRDQIHIQTLNAATIDDLRRALLGKAFDIVHFSGHGTKNGLVFEDANGRIMVPSSEALAELLLRRSVKTVLLNACYSLSVGRLTSIGAEFTIATTGPISDPAAIEFTRGFYDSIGAGYDATDAYEEGMSTAKLKDLRIDSILLRSGEEYLAPEQLVQSSSHIETALPRTLLGVAVDTSGSMASSIQNRAGGDLSRFRSVQESLTDIGKRIRDELLKRSDDVDDHFRVFIYSFGMRIGSGVADIASLWRASKNMDLASQIATRKLQYEEQGRRQAASYGPLADLARRHGFGGIVDSVTNAAMSSAREKIVAEIGDQVLAEAERIGDSNLTAQELSEVFQTERSNTDTCVLEQVVYGLTPMAAAAKEIKARFQRTEPTGYEQRILLIISDGSPSDGDPRRTFSDMKSDGIMIISCFVTSDDIADPRVLFGSPQSTWTEGARLMWDIASDVDESTPFARYLLSQGWSIEPGARLFVQANHSDVLSEFVRIAASHFTEQSVELLPKGR